MMWNMDRIISRVIHLVSILAKDSLGKISTMWTAGDEADNQSLLGAVTVIKV